MPTAVVTPDYGAMLNAAYAAYDRLMTGANVVTVHDQNGEQVTYSQANSGRLAQYISLLEFRCGVRPVVTTPLRVIF